MAFAFEENGIIAARQVVERAIRTINFRNENDKLNLWTAYFNLEYKFGAEKNLISFYIYYCLIKYI